MHMVLWPRMMYLRAISLILSNAMTESGADDGFVGHLTPTDFVMIT